MQDSITEKSWYMEFIEHNAWAFVLVIASLIAQWTVFGYRLNIDEARIDKQDARITIVENGQQTVAVSLAGIQKDIEYIRLKLDKIAP